MFTGNFHMRRISCSTGPGPTRAGSFDEGPLQRPDLRRFGMAFDSQREFRALLDEISDCFIRRDFQAWRDRLLLPFSLITKAGPVVLETQAEVRQNFDLYLQACDAMQLDQVVRRPMNLEECPDGTWIGTYETNLLRHGHRATDPYVSSALFHVVNGRFIIASILNARGHADWTGVQPGHRPRRKLPRQN